MGCSVDHFLLLGLVTSVLKWNHSMPLNRISGTISALCTKRRYRVHKTHSYFLICVRGHELKLSYVDVNAACSFAMQGETVILLEISQM